MGSQFKSWCKSKPSSRLRKSSAWHQNKKLRKDPQRKNETSYGKPVLNRSEKKDTRIKSLFQNYESRSNLYESKNAATKPQVPAALIYGVLPGFKKLENANYVDRRFSDMNQHAQESHSGPQRENFPGGTKVDTGAPKSYWAPPSFIGAHAVKSFFVGWV